MIKKYNDKKNIAGTLIKIAREEKGITKTKLSKLLELQRCLYQQRWTTVNGKESIDDKGFWTSSHLSSVEYRPK